MARVSPTYFHTRFFLRLHCSANQITHTEQDYKIIKKLPYAIKKWSLAGRHPFLWSHRQLIVGGVASNAELESY